MPPADPKEPNTALTPEATEEMAKFGITRVAVDFFHCGEFRYSNLKDALAQARRQQKST